MNSRDAELKYSTLQKQFDATQELAHLGSWTLDLLDNTQVWSDGVFHILRAEPQSFDPSFETFMSFMSELDQAKVRNGIQDALSGKKDYDIFHNIHRRDGSVCNVHARAKVFFNEENMPIKLIGTVLDVTEQTVLQQETKNAELNLENITNTITDLISYKDLDLKYTGVNRAFCEFMGLTKEEIIGKTDFDLFAKEDAIKINDLDKSLLKSSKSIYFEEDVPNSLGEVMHLFTQKHVLKDAEGTVYGIVGSVRDITEMTMMKNRQEDLTKALLKKVDELAELNNTLESKVEQEVSKNRLKDQQLLQQSRMAQMGEMISMIAHQWRQPLAAISATSATIELKASFNRLTDDVAMVKARNISKYAQHLSETIDDFRNFFKPDKAKKETTYDELVISVLGIIEVPITIQNIQLHRELNCHKPFRSYPNELKQVILNLVKNAEDALLEKAVEEPYIKIVTYPKEGRHILEVSDNAGGIPEEIIESVFDPYFSTKKAKEGTGLGLYMSKMIIEKHCGGELSVSNGSDGAVFKITLGATNG